MYALVYICLFENIYPRRVRRRNRITTTVLRLIPIRYLLLSECDGTAGNSYRQEIRSTVVRYMYSNGTMYILIVLVSLVYYMYVHVHVSTRKNDLFRLRLRLWLRLSKVKVKIRLRLRLGYT